MIQERQKAREEKNLVKEWQFSKRIKNAIKKDKRRYWAEQPRCTQYCDAFTFESAKQCLTKIRNDKGINLPSCERPEVLADYFENQQWGQVMSEEQKARHNKDTTFRNTMLFEEQAPVRTGYYTLEELRRAVKKMTNKKAPGPDEVRVELFKTMDEESLALVLSTINSWRRENKPPEILATDV